jgi:hypothetical protein
MRDVVVAWLDVPPADRCLRVDAWNVAPLEVRADG